MLSHPWRQLGNFFIVISLISLGWIYSPYMVAQFQPYLGISLPDSVDSWATVVRSRKSKRPFAYLPQTGDGITILKGSLLVIPALNVSVPIVKNVDTRSQRYYNQVLKDGVGHMKGTAAIDASIGNTLIFGHSSRLLSSGTPYDTVFANLPDIKPNDQFEVVVDGQRQQFTVTESKAINPNDVSILKNSKHREVVLLTCWPLGTTLKRWIVKGTKI